MEGENKMAKRKIDFSGVETFQTAPEGRHAAKITSVEETTFQSGNDGFKVVFEITKGVGKGAKVYENYPLAENALWKLKSLLEAIKIKCDGRIQLDTDKMVGKVLEIEVSHEDYEGKTRARRASTSKLGVSDDSDDDETLFDEEEDEDIDDEEDDEEVEETPKKAKKPAKKATKKSAKKEEPEEDDWDEEDEEEEKPAPKKTKKASAKKSKKPAKKEVEEDDDDEDWDDWDEE